MHNLDVYFFQEGEYSSCPTDMVYFPNLKLKRDKRWGAFTKPLLPWKSSITYFCMCVGVCVRVRAWCVRTCLCVRPCGCADTFLRACSLSYPVCQTQTPNCLRPVWLQYILRHYLINGTIFGKKKLPNMKCVLIFSTTFIWIFLNFKIIQWDIATNACWYLCKVFVIFIEF